jgi:hypothetical protein
MFKTLFKNFISWLAKQKNLFYVGLLVFVLTMYYMPYFTNNTVSGSFDGNIQNKLVWSVKNECYFVRPLNRTDVILVRVIDCDKGNK